MPSLSVKLDADSGPMSAEFAKAEVIAKRFGKTMAEVRAEENAALLQSSAAIKALNAERMAAKSELARYNATLMANSEGLKTSKDLHQSENAALLQKSAILKGLNREAQLNKGISGALMTAGTPGQALAYLKQNKINDYLRSKAAIMGTTGSGMAPGFAKLLATESAVLGSTGGSAAGKGWLASFTENLKGHGSGGMAQLIHVGRATFDSLASGISPWRVLLQQGPQALQAFASMTGEALGKIAKVLFSPVTLGVTAAVAAVAAGGYFIYRYFQNLSAGLENVGEKFGLARATMSEMRDEMEKSGDAAREFNKWMHSLAGETMSVADKTSVLLKRLREQFQLETEIAKLKGATPKQIFEMEQSQLQTEQNVINRAREAAYERKRIHQQEAKDAEMAIKNSGGDRIAIANAEKESAQAAKFAEAVKQKLGIGALQRQMELQGPNGRVQGDIIGSNPMTGQPIFGADKTVSSEIEKLSNTIVDIDVEGQHFHGSLTDATREMNGFQATAEKLKDVQAKLAEVLAKKEKMTQADVDSIKSLGKQEADIITALNLKKQYGGTILSGGGGQGARDLGTNQRIGAYAAPQVQTQIDLARQGNMKLDEIIKNTKTRENSYSLDAAFGG